MPLPARSPPRSPRGAAALLHRCSLPFRPCAAPNSSSSSSSAPQRPAPPPPPPALWPAVVNAYARATAAGAVYTTDTAATRLEDGGWGFVLRSAVALLDKDGKDGGSGATLGCGQADGRPGAAAEAGGGGGEQLEVGTKPPPKPDASAVPAKKPFFNPFLPYDAALWVARLPPRHELLLNKFNLAARHVLVVTSDFERQEAPLTPADLAAAWAVLTAFPGAGGLCYFNRGPASGASQPHKHLQVVPLPLDSDGDADPGARAPFEVAALEAASTYPPLTPAPVTSLPFRAYAARMPEKGVTGEGLAACVEALAGLCGVPPGGADVPGPAGEPPTIPTASYNLLLTRRVALAVPRSAESYGPAGINAVAYAGSLFAKTPAGVAWLVQEGPMRVLAECGVPW